LAFNIRHIFTHQTGACNARNLALSHVESEWVFFNDDDNKFSCDLIENVLKSNMAQASLQLRICKSMKVKIIF
jgi:hypothetical protein